VMNRKEINKFKYGEMGDAFADSVINAVSKVLKGLYKEFKSSELSFKNFVPVLPNRKTYLTKSMAILMLISVTAGLTGIGSIAPRYTLAYYEDTEKSEDNTFLAGEIDFLLESTNFSPTTTAISLSPGDITQKVITVIPEDSNPFKYVASSTNFGGDSDFCDVLNVQADLEGVDVYDDLLINMLTDATTTLDTWDLTIGMGVNNLQNKICTFDTDYTGSQTRHDYELGEGFNDTETVEHKIASWGFRINKVYYDVAPDRGVERDNEWVEIYNQTNVALDINGWEICDNKSCDTLSALEPIPPMGYGFIVASSTTASTTLPAFWYLPEDVVEINIPDTAIGNGLGNDNDMLILKRPDGVIIDQMNWGDSPDPDWDNYNDDVWHPGSVDVAEGNALARVPSGFDTNQASDFTELIPPSVDLTYPDEAGSYSWYWGDTYTIEWTATNNNGDDADLDMRLFYVKDVNHTDEIDDGDVMVTIAETTDNDGEYKWTVPNGFLGYIWIYLVATGPENPMLNTGTISGDIWDPQPVFIGEEGVDPANVDFEAPVITINGNNPAYIAQGGNYADLGALVTDNVDDNLGINVSGSVDTSLLGEYEITYTATDNMGNVGSAIRKVVVYDPLIGIPTPPPPSPILPPPPPEPSATTTPEIIIEPGLMSTTTPETIIVPPPGPVATTTPEIIIDEDTATTTVEILIEEDSATTTPEIIIEPGLMSTTTPETVGDNATTTPEIIIDLDTSTTTPTTIIEEEMSTTTPTVIIDPEPLATTTPDIILNPGPVATTTPEVILEDPVIEPEPVVEPEPEPESEDNEPPVQETEPEPEPTTPNAPATPPEPEPIVEEPVLVEDTNETPA
jgi:hypothetical protein